MNSDENAIHELKYQLKQIEYVGIQLANATNQYGYKLVGEEIKIAAALLHMNDVANIVSELIDKIERENV